MNPVRPGNAGIPVGAGSECGRVPGERNRWQGCQRSQARPHPLLIAPFVRASANARLDFPDDQRKKTPVDSSNGAASFATTHWSLVAAAGDSQYPESTQALEHLCRAYWRPLYYFARRSGHTHDDARDLTQGFFEHLLRKKALALADPNRGRFRSFLLTSLKHFLAHEREHASALKRGGGQPILSLEELDAENGDALQLSESQTPETLFDQRWASQQINHAVERLRREYAESGKVALFDLLKDYVWGEHNTLTLADIAADLDLTEEAVKKSVQRLRQRFRDCLRAEIAQTVTTPDQIDDELRHLRAVLTSGR